MAKVFSEYGKVALHGKIQSSSLLGTQWNVDNEIVELFRVAENNGVQQDNPTGSASVRGVSV